MPAKHREALGGTTLPRHRVDGACARVPAEAPKAFVYTAAARRVPDAKAVAFGAAAILMNAPWLDLRQETHPWHHVLLVRAVLSTSALLSYSEPHMVAEGHLSFIASSVCALVAFEHTSVLVNVATAVGWVVLVSLR